MKVAINKDYGGFGLSKAAYKELGLEWDGYGKAYQDKRTDPKLIAVIEKLGVQKASGPSSSIKVIDIPDDVKWTIEQCDGKEWVAEEHSIWD